MSFSYKTLAVATVLSLGGMSSAVYSQSVDAKPAGDATPVMVVDTPHFLSQTLSSNQFEIQSSELAKEKSQDEDALALADMIIADHTKAGEKLDALLADRPDKPVTPVVLAPKHAKMLSQLEAAEGDDFNTLFIDIQAQAHLEAVALFRTYAGSGEDQTIVGFAKETLPALETHLAHVKAIMHGEHQ